VPFEFEQLFQHDTRPEEETAGLVRLMSLFAALPPPPDPFGLYPDYPQLKEKFLVSAKGKDPDRAEEDFLSLYSHVHGYEVPYTDEERRRVEALGGYLNHVGGISPLLMAGPFIAPETVSGDFGAGNGLQGLLLQYLYPHKKTVQIEISNRMIEAGRQLQGWIGIPEERVEWIAKDISEVSPASVDFVYLYRPVRPQGPGRRFYEDFATRLEAADGPRVIFSIADCLKGFLSPVFEVFYTDGHLTCFRRRGDGRMVETTGPKQT
jgi:hypothetical protein